MHAHSWKFVLVILAVATPAHAYLNPDSGSMILQLLLGGAAGLAVLTRMFWGRLLHVLGLRKLPASTRSEVQVESDTPRA